MVAKCYGLVERPGSIIGGPDARFLFDKLQLNMKELSIFVDESGDFGKYDFHSPYYILAFVFHDQENDISEEIAVLNHKLSRYGLQNRAVHTGPVIRKEEEYSAFTIEDRRTIMRHLISFYRHAEINCTAVHIEKKHIGVLENMAAALAAKISAFITKYLTVFQSFDVVKIYYDNGQILVSKILHSVFCSLLVNVQFKKAVKPSNYRLFQIADMICTMELIRLKMETNLLSNSELSFFGEPRVIRRSFLKIIDTKKLQ